MLSPELMQMGVLLLGAIAVASLVFTFAFPYLSGEKQTEKRIKGVTENRASRSARRAAAEQGAQRKQAVADTLKTIEDQQKKSKKVTLRMRLRRAGLDMSVNSFYMFSLVFGLVFGGALFVLVPGLSPYALGVLVVVGAFGVPRWFLGFLTKRRQKKFLNELANAIDVIVRGVKSGLPLNECLGIIARESPEPLASEFREVIDEQRVGVPLGECFDRMCSRMPLPEVRFFAIVIAIQQSAGGNLSEALGNLSSVIRSRKMMREKIKAMSSEAKASAMIIGSLPFAVGLLVFMTTPDYIMELFRTETGHVVLATGSTLMFTGIMTMKKMINFDI
jgi:tight adherence protein B